MAQAGSRSEVQRGRDRGIAAEYRAIADLVSKGYIVIRSSGSHGPFDMVAVRPDGARFIQVKAVRDPLPASLFAELERLARLMPMNCSVELWRTAYRKRSFEVTVF